MLLACALRLLLALLRLVAAPLELRESLRLHAPGALGSGLGIAYFGGELLEPERAGGACACGIGGTSRCRVAASGWRRYPSGSSERDRGLLRHARGRESDPA